MIGTTDILDVAKDIFSLDGLSDDEIKYVKDNYEAQAEADPTGYWRLYVEDLLYQIIKKDLDTSD